MSPFYIFSDKKKSDPCKMRVIVYGPRFYRSVGSHNYMHICAFRQKGVACCTQLLKIPDGSVCDIDEFD